MKADSKPMFTFLSFNRRTLNNNNNNNNIQISYEVHKDKNDKVFHVLEIFDATSEILSLQGKLSYDTEGQID